jgi:hypothetical protein
MIYSSLNLDPFIVRPLSGGGLYPNLEEDQGLRSGVTKCPKINRHWFGVSKQKGRPSHEQESR